jgi:hypothetical protein
MADIFISYAREDRSRIEPLAKSLQSLGWSVFWDRTIPAGKTWRQVIGDALKTTRLVIVAWSKDSIESDWVQEEADRGRRRNILIPVLIDNIDPPLGFGTIQAADLTSWNPAQSSPEFEKLISDISIILGPSPIHVKKGKLSAKEDSQRLEQENRRIAEERRRLEEERQQAETERKAEEERKRKEIEVRRKTEEERNRKQTEEEAGRTRKEQVERKAEPPKAGPSKPIAAQVPIEETKVAKPEPSEPKPVRTEPSGKSPAAKIAVLIAFVVVIVAGAILVFRQEPTRSVPEISASQGKPAEQPVAAKPSEPSPSKKIKNSIGMEFVPYRRDLLRWAAY